MRCRSLNDALKAPPLMSSLFTTIQCKTLWSFSFSVHPLMNSSCMRGPTLQIAKFRLSKIYRSLSSKLRMWHPLWRRTARSIMTRSNGSKAPNLFNNSKRYFQEISKSISIQSNFWHDFWRNTTRCFRESSTKWRTIRISKHEWLSRLWTKILQNLTSWSKWIVVTARARVSESLSARLMRKSFLQKKGRKSINLTY